MVKTSSNAGGTGFASSQGPKVLRVPWPKNQNIKQKQYYNKFNKDFISGPHQKNPKNPLKICLKFPRLVRHVLDTWDPAWGKTNLFSWTNITTWVLPVARDSWNFFSSFFLLSTMEKVLLVRLHSLPFEFFSDTLGPFLFETFEFWEFGKLLKT